MCFRRVHKTPWGKIEWWASCHTKINQADWSAVATNKHGKQWCIELIAKRLHSDMGSTGE